MIETSSSTTPTTTTDCVQITINRASPPIRMVSKFLRSLFSVLIVIAGILMVAFLTLLVQYYRKDDSDLALLISLGILFFVSLLSGMYCFVLVAYICINEKNFVVSNARLYRFIAKHWPCRGVSEVMTYHKREYGENTESTQPVEDSPEIEDDANLPNAIADLQVQANETNIVDAEVHEENSLNLDVPPRYMEERSRPVSFPYVISQSRAVSILAPKSTSIACVVSKSAPGGLKEISPHILDYSSMEEFGSQQKVLPDGSNISVSLNAGNTSVSKDERRHQLPKNVHGQDERQITATVEERAEGFTGGTDAHIEDNKNVAIFGNKSADNTDSMEMEHHQEKTIDAVSMKLQENTNVALISKIDDIDNQLSEQEESEELEKIVVQQ